MIKTLHYTTLLSIAYTLFSCNTNTDTTNTNNNIESNDSVQQESQIEIKNEALASVAPPEKHINFDAWAISKNDSLKKEFKNFSNEEIELISYINKADKKHLPRIDTILIPQTFKNILDFSPFPLKMAILHDIPKIVLFSYPTQNYAVYENGILVKWGPTNMGKKATPTPTGLFFTNWKGKEVRSSIDKSWILKWNFNVHNTQGVGWHEYELPGYPASHSCMRLLAEDAKWLYDWADQWKLDNNKQLAAKGTPTIIYGAYLWGERRPWKFLLENPAANDISIQDLENIILPYKDKILEAQKERTQYLEKTKEATTSNDSLKVII
jgi:hypothetical protein